jgi:hypothetical protein
MFEENYFVINEIIKVGSIIPKINNLLSYMLLLLIAIKLNEVE